MNWLIKLLGGYTQEEYETATWVIRSLNDACDEAMEKLKKYRRKRDAKGRFCK